MDNTEITTEHTSPRVNSLRITVPSTPKITKKVSWNDRLEQAAKNIGELASGYKYMHMKQAQHAEKVHKYLMISSIIVGPLSGVVTGINAFVGNTTGLSILSAVMGFLSGIMAAIVKFNKYDEASIANKQSAIKYTSIESNVRRQLSLYRKDRVPAASYMEWLEAKYEEVLSTSPLLPNRVYSAYREIAGKNSMPIPDSEEIQITINTEPSDNSDGESEIDITSVNLSYRVPISDENRVPTQNFALQAPPIVTKKTKQSIVRFSPETSPSITQTPIQSPIQTPIPSAQPRSGQPPFLQSSPIQPSPIQLQRDNKRRSFSSIEFSDKMLEYEMKRMLKHEEK